MSGDTDIYLWKQAFERGIMAKPALFGRNIRIILKKQ
jgi:hypothetical protein